jgi:hypothetical protein
MHTDALGEAPELGAFIILLMDSINRGNSELFILREEGRYK